MISLTTLVDAPGPATGPAPYGGGGGKMTRRGLGELEQQVLLTILQLGGEAYSVPVVLELEARSGREVSQAAVYIVLRRLEEKGLVSSRIEHAEDTETARER